MALTLPHAAMVQVFAARPDNDLPEVPSFNLCPTQAVHVVTGGEVRRLRPMRWGLIPHWYKAANDGPLLINARAETVAEKPAFRAAIRDRRCIVVASGYYEWTVTPDKVRLPWYVTRTDGAPMALGGLWQDWGPKDGDAGPTCAVVTTAANAEMSDIHHRMPLLLEEADWPLWLGEAGKGAAALMRPAAEGAVQARRVGREVNSSRATGPGLIEPLDDDAT